MWFLVRYSKDLEQGQFAGRTADFAWMLMFGAGVMLIVASVVYAPFLGQALTSYIVYIWGRLNPYVRLNFLGVDLTGPALPWFHLGLSLMFQMDIVDEVLGIAVGHLYYFCVFVFPNMTYPKKELLYTPAWVQTLFGNDLTEVDGFVGHRIVQQN